MVKVPAVWADSFARTMNVPPALTSIAPLICTMLVPVKVPAENTPPRVVVVPVTSDVAVPAIKVVAVAVPPLKSIPKPSAAVELERNSVAVKLYLAELASVTESAVLVNDAVALV